MEMKQEEYTFLFYDDGKEVGVIYCEKMQDTMQIAHVIVNEDCQGKGYASKMMKLLVEHFESKHIAFTWTCSYAVAWMKKNR